MVDHSPDDSVRKEQFNNNVENNSEQEENNNQEPDANSVGGTMEQSNLDSDEEKSAATGETEQIKESDEGDDSSGSGNAAIEVEAELDRPKQASPEPSEISAEDAGQAEKEVSTEDEQEHQDENSTSEGAITDGLTPDAVDQQPSSDTKNSTVNVTRNTSDDQVETGGQESSEDSTTDEPETTEKLPKDKPQHIKPIDYINLKQQDPVAELKRMLDEKSFNELRNKADIIKKVFYKKLHDQAEEIKSKFLKQGGAIEDFKLEEIPIEKTFKEQYQRYKEMKTEMIREVEVDKKKNLEEKYRVIEKLKELINSKESLNQTFHDFRELQNRWHAIGVVPQSNVKELWEQYHFQVEAFYDYIKINKELRDLDLKKNLEAKIKLCERAEELLLEPSIVEAFRKLQELHNTWRETGPVPAEKRDELWERFKQTTKTINKKHQEYFVSLKKEQKANLEAKTTMCEKVEQLSAQEFKTAQEWESTSKEIIEIQKVWRTIGFAPKKHNTKIYQRFRTACDSFFQKKREFFTVSDEEHEKNIQQKLELCEQAEALKDSADWPKTTDKLIALQRQWKDIGPVKKKESDKVWKRFRSACDTFFTRKAEFFSNKDKIYEENLTKKLELIQEIEDYVIIKNVDDNLAKLQEFQKRWTEIGFVPIKQKDEIQKKFREVINRKFDNLNVNDDYKRHLKFHSRVQNILTKPNADSRIRAEREKIINKIKHLENDVGLWENNIGYFSDSKNAKSMISDIQEKIEQSKQKIETLKDQINIINDLKGNH
jgi:hypothetical protein